MNDALHSGGKCPTCGWESGDEAFFCARCGESLAGTPREAWYLRTSILILSFLAVGPFAIPLVWVNPRFTAAKKAVVTAVMVGVTAALLWLSVYSLKQIRTYYDFIGEPWPGAAARPSSPR
ncbi:MAG: hypothetical protein WCP22_13025 [Chlamydiota bacterium]